MSAAKRTVVPLLAGGLLLGLAAWALLTPTRRAQVEEPTTAAATSPEPAAPATAEEPAPERADRVEVAAPLAPAPAGDTDLRPASYRRWLGRVVGRVVDFDGSPVPSLSVDAYVADLVTLLPATSALFAEKPYRPRILDASARTNAEGRFVLEEVDPKMPHALLLGLGTARATARFLEHAPGPAETVDVGDIVLAPYAILTGRVVDEAGRGVAGARIRATDLPQIVLAVGASELRPGSALYADKRVIELPRWADDLIERFPVPAAKTDSEGAFRLEGAPVAANVTVLLDHPQFVTVVRDPISTKEGGERDLGKLGLEAGEVLTGSVVDASGRPVEGAELLAGTKIPLGEVAVMRQAGKSDAQGKFRVPAMAAAPAFVACRRGPPDPWTVVGPVSPGLDPADVRLPGLHEVELMVRNAEGLPVREGVEILWRRADDLSEVAVLAPPLRAKWRRGGEEGVYVVERVQDGKYAFLVRATGYAVGTAEVEVKEGTGRGTLVLEPSNALLVRVLAEGAGEPIEYAYVGARPEGRSIFPAVSARTDARGEARLEGLAKGEIGVFGFHPAYAFVLEKATLPAETVTLRLRGGGSIEGRVHSGGAPPPEPLLVVAGSEGPVPRMPRFTTTDAAGSFRITHVDPGEYELHAVPRLGDRGFGGFIEWAEAADRSEKTDVRVEAGKTSTVEIDLRGETENGGTIRGRVWVNGRPAEGATVRALSERSRSASADANGAYELPGVKAGDVRVSVSLRRSDGMPFGDQLVSRQVKLQAGAVEEVNFEVETGGLAGKVVSAKTGAAVPQAHVWATRVAEKPGESREWANANVMSDSEGRFRMKEVRTGTYDVHARTDGHAPGKARVTVSGGGEAAEIVIVLPSSVVVKGRVIFDVPPEGSRWVGVGFSRKRAEGEGAGEDWGGWARITLPEGTFETQELAPGTYLARVMGQGARYRQVEVVIPEGGTSSLVLHAVPETDPPRPPGVRTR